MLGLEVIERKTSPRGSHLAFLKVPNSDELIQLTSFPPSGPVTVQEDLSIWPSKYNLEQTIALLNAKGIRITDGPTTTILPGSRFIFIDVLNGYEIELIERPAGVKIV